jgi:AhpD family alkylhydroperoxidase
MLENIFLFSRKHFTMNKIEEFRNYRTKMNQIILEEDNLFFKRFFNLDSRSYEEGALDAKTKEMLGLVSSLVLRCDDCVKYHIEKCHELGVTRAQFFEILAIGNLVGGSIVIPHTRRAIEYWDLL